MKNTKPKLKSVLQRGTQARKVKPKENALMIHHSSASLRQAVWKRTDQRIAYRATKSSTPMHADALMELTLVVDVVQVGGDGELDPGDPM